MLSSMDTDSNTWTRRRALAAGAVGIASAAGLTALGGDDASGAPHDHSEKRAAKGGGPKRMPVVFIPHGGGPWPFVDLGMDPTELDSLAEYLRALPASTKDRPRALLVISAHWEERVPTLMTNARPPLLYDYYGFPPESYQISWPAPGAPELAARVEQLLASRGEESVPAHEKIVSIFEPHTDVIVKARRETLYGHKVFLNVGASGMIIDMLLERGNPSDATRASARAPT